MKVISIFLTHSQDASEFLWEVFLGWLLCWKGAICRLHGMLHLSDLPSLFTISDLKKGPREELPQDVFFVEIYWKKQSSGDCRLMKRWLCKESQKRSYLSLTILISCKKITINPERWENDWVSNKLNENETRKNFLALWHNLLSLSVIFTSVNTTAYVWGRTASHHVPISCPSCPLHTLLC